MNRATVAGVSVGDGREVAVVGTLNVSPESFYSGSVVTDADRLLRAAHRMAEAGAAWPRIPGWPVWPPRPGSASS